MTDVFISYAREDRARAEQVARGLTAMGLECFWDTEIPPGQTWSDYVEGKLDAARAVVVLWSQHSTKSQWVREEARMGRDKAKLIPAVIDGSAPPLGFGEVQAADLTAWQGSASDPQWTRFANAVFTAARGTAPPQSQTPPQPAPSAWRASPAAGASGATLSPIDYVKKCLRLYVGGQGRARRTEFWWWAAFVCLVGMAAYLLDIGISGANPYTYAPNAQVVTGVAWLALLAPGVAVMARRLHDAGLSGWIAAGIVAAYIVGALFVSAAMDDLGALIVLASMAGAVIVGLLPGKPGPNQYGPDPKMA
ncbi:MAG TPA: TIR domain-containing protein [Candidatus Binatia bacterium]|nr:TIR domain-containing protein [Candidatus Binatia bacterium]